MGHPITLGIDTFHSLCSNLWMIHPSSNCYLPKTGTRHSVPYIVFTALTDCRSSRVIELPRRWTPPDRRRGTTIGALITTKDPAMSRHKIPRVERDVRRADPANRIKTWLVIALCIFTMFAVIFGLIYDKSRWA